MNITPEKFRQRLDDIMFLVASDFFRRILEDPTKLDPQTLRDVARFLDAADGEILDAIGMAIGISFKEVRKRLDLPFVS